jgi:hypothetical protein
MSNKHAGENEYQKSLAIQINFFICLLPVI